jgi:hypothetical protein
MCTVTFIPVNNTVYLSSNRDEKMRRSLAVPPKVYSSPLGNLLFPRDADAGGTWIAARDNGNAIVFLNGGFVAHAPMPHYGKSRGLILLDLLNEPEPVDAFNSLELDLIEPFTAITWSDQQLHECRWDGQEKHCTQLNIKKPHIWSSVTLYDPQTINKRESWFESWIKTHLQPSQNDILHFHEFTGDGDAGNDLKMQREGKVSTVSISSLAIREDMISMQYLDLKQGQVFQESMTLEKSLAGR